jgi:murein DD-endopeptidase MepM/ murein hydrolase activator NlpD
VRRSDDTLWLLLALGVVVMTYDPVEWGDPLLWHWPIGDLITGSLVPAYYPAAISQEFRRADHLGVDLMYKRQGQADPPGVSAIDHASAQWFAPVNTPIVAARDGLVWSVDKSPRGIEVVLDHGKPFATYYQHLSSTVLPVGTFKGKAPNGQQLRVRAGQVIGQMGYDPTDPQGLRHLHFAVWYGGNNESSVDPQRAMRSWQRSAWRL